jgi:hypothetical protein
MIRTQEETRCCAYVYFIMVLLLFPSQNEKLSYIFFHLIDFFMYMKHIIRFYQSRLKGKDDINNKRKTLLH